MKRLFVSLIFIVVILSACSKGNMSNRQNIIVNFTAQANVLTDTGDIYCSVSRAADKVSCISIYEPDQMKGLKYICLDDKCKIEYNNLSYETDKFNLPEIAVPQAIVNVLDSIDNGVDLKLTASYDNISVLKGKCDVGTFEIMVNKSTGYIEKIIMESIKMTVIFSEQE